MLSFENFIARRISSKEQNSFSRSIVKIAVTGVTLGLAVMIISFSIVLGFKSEIQNKIMGFSGAIQLLKYDFRTSVENNALTLTPEDSLFLQSKKEDIAFIQPFASKTAILSANDEIEGIVLKGVDQNYNQNFLQERLISGSFPTLSKDSLVNEILLSSFTAKRLGLETGDNVLVYFIQEPVRKRKLKVSGIFDTGIEDLNKMYAVCDLKLIQRMNNWSEKEVGGYEIGTYSHSLPQIDSLSINLFNNLSSDITSSTAAERYPAIFDWLSLLDVNGEVILILMLAVVSINMISALLILILERTNMIGLLKALGAENRSIQKIFLLKAGRLIAKGMLYGNVLGISICMIQKYFKIIPLDEHNYYMKYVPIQIDWFVISTLNAGTFGACLLVLIIPSMMVMRISPVKALKFK